jgi:tetratricopeptide (TPR) repeat protein
MRPSFDNAVDYFTNVANHPGPCPDFLRVQALFAYGDAFSQYAPTNALERFSIAQRIFRQIPLNFPNDALVPQAWGRMADCYFQLGTNDPANYLNALENYGKVTNSPRAELSTRLAAMVGIGNVQRQQARLAKEKGAALEANSLLSAALDNYLSVAYGTFEAEQPDPFWIKEAALKAADIDESQNKWDRALNVYRHLIDVVPGLAKSPTIEKRILRASEQAALQK